MWYEANRRFDGFAESLFELSEFHQAQRLNHREQQVHVRVGAVLAGGDRTEHTHLPATGLSHDLSYLVGVASQAPRERGRPMEPQQARNLGLAASDLLRDLRLGHALGGSPANCPHQLKTRARCHIGCTMRDLDQVHSGTVSGGGERQMRPRTASLDRARFGGHPPLLSIWISTWRPPPAMLGRWSS